MAAMLNIALILNCTSQKMAKNILMNKINGYARPRKANIQDSAGLIKTDKYEPNSRMIAIILKEKIKRLINLIKTLC
jgi:hypothetical protein